MIYPCDEPIRICAWCESDISADGAAVPVEDAIRGQDWRCADEVICDAVQRETYVWHRALWHRTIQNAMPTAGLL